MKQRKCCRKGAAMLWAVLVMLMIAIITSGIIFISRIYYVRERNENYQLQAEMYAESAIELVRKDIEDNQDASVYVSDSNDTKVYTFSFPDASNWTCTVTVNHSIVDTSSDDTKKKSGQIYLTARVKRSTPNGKELELSEVCAKMTCPAASKQWQFDGYYNL